MLRARPPLALFLAAGCLAAFALATAQDVCDGVSPVNNSNLKSVVVATGLAGRPLFVTAPPGDTDRIFIVEQDGRIWLKHRGTTPAELVLFLDITDRVFTALLDNEAGLLGLAFDTDFATTGEFYVNYFAGSGSFTCATDCRTVVSRFTVSGADPDAADPASEQILMEIAQPQNNHNGGQVAFGPEGMLYVFTGDGGGANDGHGTCGNGQIVNTLLGKILRVDVNGVDPAGTAPDTTCFPGFLTGTGYTVPSDNPFADGAGGACDEVWAYGLRNPWRNDFDPVTGDLYVADVGQDCWEEVDFTASSSAAGGNYGWRQMEGNHCFDPTNTTNCDPAPVACGSSPACNDPGLTDPVLEFNHGDPGSPCSITGGNVYRGCRMPNFDRTYFYGDFCAGFIRSFEISGGQATNPRDWTTQLDPGGTLANGLTSFGRDARGEIYIVDRAGEVRKILPPFPDFEVSGLGARQFLLHRTADWTWEDLEFTSMHPVDFYRVYRGVPGGVFQCVHSTAATRWPAGGDPASPNPGELLAYVVTAVSPEAEETSSGDPPRDLSNPCPPPA